MLLLCSVEVCFLFSVVSFSEFQFQLHFNLTLKWVLTVYSLHCILQCADYVWWVGSCSYRLIVRSNPDYWLFVGPGHRGTLRKQTKKGGILSPREIVFKCFLSLEKSFFLLIASLQNSQLRAWLGVVLMDQWISQLLGIRSLHFTILVALQVWKEENLFWKYSTGINLIQ